METLLLLTYSAICIVVFKVFKVPLNKWTVPTAVLGGVILIGGIVILMNYHHPFTDVARTTVATTPIVPLVKGRVIEVPVEANKPLNKGDILFEIDPTPYRAEVDEQRAALAEAEQDVLQLKAALDQAVASAASTQAERDLAQKDYSRAVNIAQKDAGAISRQTIDELSQRLAAAEEEVREAQAAAEEARLDYRSEIDGENTTVAQIQARLNDAEFDLEQTVMRAPTDGMVTQVLLRPGMIAVSAPFRPTMVFIHKAKDRLVASFVQNSLRRVEPGNEAEVIFKALPGHVFKGEVDFILPVMAEGELQATGRLITFGDVSGGRVPVVIKLHGDLSEVDLPSGIAAQVAVYNDDGFLVHHIAIIRRILLRMSSWKNYVFGPIH